MSHWNAGDVFRDNYIVRGEAQLRHFDSLLDERDLQRKLDEGRPFVVKIDIEGHEIHALRGANRLLSHPNKPRLIHTEAWRTLNCTALAELMFSYYYEADNDNGLRAVTTRRKATKIQKLRVFGSIHISLRKTFTFLEKEKLRP